MIESGLNGNFPHASQSQQSRVSKANGLFSDWSSLNIPPNNDLVEREYERCATTASPHGTRTQWDVEQTATPNIIIFGESGIGKSSLVNMMDGDRQAKVGSSAVGVTLDTRRYSRVIDGQEFNIFDTAGLNEGENGSVTANQALSNLWNLISSLDGGVHLIIFVIRGGRITASSEHNYHLFYDALCERKVPIMLVVTGLEHHERSMDSWWINNSQHFHRYRMTFDGVACITSLKNSQDSETQKRYNESKTRIEDLILLKYEKNKDWNRDKVTWARKTMIRGIAFFSTRLGLLAAVGRQKAVIQALVDHGGMTEKEALAWWAKTSPHQGTGTWLKKAFK